MDIERPESCSPVIMSEPFNQSVTFANVRRGRAKVRNLISESVLNFQYKRATKRDATRGHMYRKSISSKQLLATLMELIVLNINS